MIASWVTNGPVLMPIEWVAKNVKSYLGTVRFKPTTVGSVVYDLTKLLPTNDINNHRVCGK